MTEEKLVTNTKITESAATEIKPQSVNSTASGSVDVVKNVEQKVWEFVPDEEVNNFELNMVQEDKPLTGYQDLPFVEFVVKKEVSLSKSKKLLESFFVSHKGSKTVFREWLRRLVFIGNVLSQLILRKKIFTEPSSAAKATEEKLKTSFSFPLEKVSRDIAAVPLTVGRQQIESVEARMLRQKELIDQGKKEKIQIKTLLLLSSRMFTSGSMRTILTILGISISIGVILFLISFGYGLQRTVLQRITTEESLLSLVVTLPDDAPIPSSALDEIKKMSGVDKVSPLTEYNGNIAMDTLQINALVYIVDQDYFALAGLMSSKGAPLKLEPSKTIISSAVVALLGLDKTLVIGNSIFLTPTFMSNVEGGVLSTEEVAKISEVQKKSFVIADVIDDDLTAYAYVLGNEFPKLVVSSFIEAKVQVKDKDQLDPIKEELINKGYVISSISDTVEETRKIFRGIQIALGFFGLVALIISAIGMLNILTIVLLERTQEIGIMKAIGASGSDIWKTVVFDAVIVGFLGGLGGSAIGLSASKLFNFIFNLLAQKISAGGQSLQLFQTPPGFIFTIVVFSAIIGFITGIWPAIRASRISPLEAIRYK